MFRDRSLLERLRSPRGGSLTATEDTAELSRSVVRNLIRMFNCRQGHAPAQMDYGLPDPVAVLQSGPDVASGMVRLIQECIGKYEPRLRDVRVSSIEDEDDPLTLRFQVSARLATSKERVPVSFDTLVNPSGQISIHE